MAEYMFMQRTKKNYKTRRSSILSDDKSHTDWMANYFLGQNNETRGGALNNQQKMRLFLRFCADSGFQNGIGENIGFHQSTASRTISEMATIISSKSKEWIKFPLTTEEIEAAQSQWQTKNCFPFAIGVIDCTHIKIKKPSDQSDEYIFRKGFHSINVQATCNANEMFTSVDISWPGSVHDSRVLRNSDLSTSMANVQNDALLLGDEGYALSSWLMTPFRNPTNDVETNFNKIFTKERVVIERCFGQLKQRFAVLQHKIRASIELVPPVIASCFVLHNTAKFLKDDFDYDLERSATMRDLWHTEVDNSDQTNAREREAAMRQCIANLLF